MSFHLYLFAIFISLWGFTHYSADCCKTDARLGGVGRVAYAAGCPSPNKHSGYAGESLLEQFSRVMNWFSKERYVSI